MALLFSEKGLHRLDHIVRPGILCVFDFDGTLSPIVQEADQARLSPGIQERLVELCRHAPVAVITGRSLQDIRSRLEFKPQFVLGNHGIEGLPGWEERGERYRQLCRSWEQALAAALQDRKRFDPEIWIENKQYSLSLHYRKARDHALAEHRLAELFEALVPEARVIAGKCVFSLLPPDAEHKGSALEKLMWISGARSAIYVGDDITDEDVFRLQRPDLLSVRVEQSALTAAEFCLEKPEDILQLLDELIRRLRQQLSREIA